MERYGTIDIDFGRVEDRTYLPRNISSRLMPQTSYREAALGIGFEQCWMSCRE